jgi:protein TonB
VRPGVELRGMRVVRLAEPSSTFHPELPKAEDGGITKPKLTHRERPVYPGRASREGISGKVLLTLVIMADGSIADLSVLSSPHQALVEPALACVRKWRFKPAMKDGAPISVTATVEVAFDLER